MAWVKVTHEYYWQQLGCLPPAFRGHNGFLIGEPYDHRRCKVTGDVMPTFAAYKCFGIGKYGTDKYPEHDEGSDFYESPAAMTLAEYLAVKREEVER